MEVAARAEKARTVVSVTPTEVNPSITPAVRLAGSTGLGAMPAEVTGPYGTPLGIEEEEEEEEEYGTSSNPFSDDLPL